MVYKMNGPTAWVRLLLVLFGFIAFVGLSCSIDSSKLPMISGSPTPAATDTLPPTAIGTATEVPTATIVPAATPIPGIGVPIHILSDTLTLQLTGIEFVPSYTYSTLRKAKPLVPRAPYDTVVVVDGKITNDPFLLDKGAIYLDWDMPDGTHHSIAAYAVMWYPLTDNVQFVFWGNTAGKNFVISFPDGIQTPLDTLPRIP